MPLATSLPILGLLYLSQCAGVPAGGEHSTMSVGRSAPTSGQFLVDREMADRARQMRIEGLIQPHANLLPPPLTSISRKSAT